MQLPTRNLLESGVVRALLGVAFCACGQSNSNSGTGGNATGGAPGSGGSTQAGGSLASGGATAGSGGVSAAGGSNAGGSKATGGTSSSGATDAGGSANGGSSSSTATAGTGGAGGAPTGGSGGATTGSTGGKVGTGGTTNAAAGGTTSGGTAGGGTSGTATSTTACQKGQVKPSEVIFMGESFYAIAPQYIQKRIESNARTAGALGANDSYRNVAISGQPMSVVAGEFDTAIKDGAVKFVIMDGGGIDCMSSSCSSCPDTFKTLLTKMASNGVQNVIYTRYPEPGNPPGSNATLKGNLDILMPKMQAVCAAASGLHCYWVDLRPVWVNGDTADGLHPTQSGGDHVGDLIWGEMVKDCLAQ